MPPPKSAFKTGQCLADEYSVSERTIRYNDSFAKAVDILPEKEKEEVMRGNASISNKDSDTISKMDKPTQKKFIKEVEKGTPIKEA